ncbi:MAG: riboflavin synthase, partial [Endomicrobiales bacterium]|nr:riboflavin synthase [Endomicrobiales bacterium]
MFTGIVEKIGEVSSISGNVLSITADFDNLVIGESIAVDGACLTLKLFSGNNLSFDLSGQTVKTISVHSFERGKKVNLERAMPANGRFGGHFVSGHIDTVTKVKNV